MWTLNAWVARCGGVSRVNDAGSAMASKSGERNHEACKSSRWPSLCTATRGVGDRTDLRALVDLVERIHVITLRAGSSRLPWTTCSRRLPCRSAGWRAFTKLTLTRVHPVLAPGRASQSGGSLPPCGRPQHQPTSPSTSSTRLRKADRKRGRGGDDACRNSCFFSSGTFTVTQTPVGVVMDAGVSKSTRLFRV